MDFAPSPKTQDYLQRLRAFIAEHVSVIPAELGSDAGVIGAAGLLWTREV